MAGGRGNRGAALQVVGGAAAACATGRADTSASRPDMVGPAPARACYFQPVDLRVNRGGSAGPAAGSGDGSRDAAAISRSSSSASGSPSS